MLDLILISTSAISLLFGIGELCVSRRVEKNYLLSVCYLILSYFLFHSYMMHSGSIHTYKRILLTSTPLLALLGPVSERYTLILLEEVHESYKKFFLKLIPTILSTIIIFPFYFRDLNKEFILNDFGIIHIENIPLYVKSAIVLSMGSLFYFCLSPMLRILRTIPIASALKYRNIGIVFIISAFSSLTIPTLLVLIFLFNRTISHYFVSTNIGLFICLIYLIKQRYPEFFITLRRDLEIEKKIRKSKIVNLDLDKIKSSLLQLLEVEKIYLNENLTLGDIAKKLQISNHQLSEYLNTVEQTQFYQLLGKYRVEEAKKNIREKPKSTFLEIALISGFNSKSNFNQVFKQISGYTPSEFKKNLSKSIDLGDKNQNS